MLWHGWVQAVDCTSFQAKMSSQNSRHGRAVLVKRTDLSQDTRVKFLQFIWQAPLFIFARLVCLASANFLPPARAAIRLQNLFA
jgi:hypothetical protein